MRRAAKVDSNHAEIVAALESIGCTVQSLARMGEGCPDLLVGVHRPNGSRANLLIEVKDGSKSPSRQALTQDQAEWFAWWKGPPVLVVNSVQQALQAVQCLQ